MILIVGLGNPGKDYLNTRHNIGRELLQAFQKHVEFAEFRFEKKWNAEVSEGKMGKEKITLLLPDTFMNKSGSAVGAASRFYKTKPAAVFVIHDDADLPLGRGKLSFGKHSAGHKGVESVIRALKTREFWRFRVGIAGIRDIPAEKLVLKKFTPDETRLVKKITKRTIEAIMGTVEKSSQIAMNEYNS
jgi:PTH1 family peptidyl-tRNA hydrolase